MLATLSSYIDKLLRQHDCVIVPGFGAFVCNRKFSFYDNDEAQIYPAVRQVVFNKHLAHDDGLLAHYWANVGQMAYEKAVEEIEKTVKILQDYLSEGEQVVWQGIGSLSKREQSILFFRQANQNYDEESFGLEVLSLSKKDIAISQMQEETYNHKNDIMRKGNSRRQESEESGSPIFVFLILALLLAGGGFAFWWFKMKPQTAVQTVTSVGIDNLQEQTPTEGQTDEEYDFLSEEPVESNYQNKKKEDAKEDYFATPAKSNGDYYVIAGVFRIQDNATRLHAKLISKGFDALIINKYPERYTVAFGSYPTKKEALRQQEQVSSLGYSAWVTWYRAQ
jgi:cell division protein FtsN